MAQDEFIDRLNARARVLNWQSRADATLSFRRPELLELGEIWNGLVATGRLPSRASFTARTLKSFLPHITILEILRSGRGKVRFVHRLVGTEIARRFGELTGLGFEDFLPPERLPATMAFLEAVIETRRALRVITHFQFEPVSYLYAEILVMPLAGDGATPDKLLSASYFSGGEELADEIRTR